MDGFVVIVAVFFFFLSFFFFFFLLERSSKCKSNGVRNNEISLEEYLKNLIMCSKERRCPLMSYKSFFIF